MAFNPMELLEKENSINSTGKKTEPLKPTIEPNSEDESDDAGE